MADIDFKDFSDFTKAFEKEVTDLYSRDQIPVDEILTKSFISQNTPYSNFDEFLEVGGFSVNTQEDFDSIEESKLNAFVAEKTRFSNFQEMIDTASQEFVEGRFKKLGFK